MVQSQVAGGGQNGMTCHVHHAHPFSAVERVWWCGARATSNKEAMREQHRQPLLLRIRQAGLVIAALSCMHMSGHVAVTMRERPRTAFLPVRGIQSVLGRPVWGDSHVQRVHCSEGVRLERLSAMDGDGSRCEPYAACAASCK
jgi:hypothetical protein